MHRECVEPWNDSWNENLVDCSPLARDPLQKICASYMDDLKKICYHRPLASSPPFQSLNKRIRIQISPPSNELSLRLAEKEGARVVVATDPDADRLAVAATGKLAALFGWWMFTCWKENCPKEADVKNVYMLATTVSSKILRAIALKEGFNFEETLPGFKWIGSRVKDLVDRGKEVLFAFEESIGFMCGTSVLDKDGVSAAVVIAEMAAWLDTKGQTLAHQLAEIYKTIFERLRNFDMPDSYPTSCGTYGILHVRDVTTGYDSSQLKKKSVLPVSKNSQMITFTFQNGCVATLRTSGTEPKIKYYAEMCALPGQSDVTLLEEDLTKLIGALVEHFLEPSKNQLTWRCCSYSSEENLIYVVETFLETLGKTTFCLRSV
ncbi:hypothetical protein E2320_005748 [Naja naja]|nr:hypothetical protein E2320_005748 [Naja naja]